MRRYTLDDTIAAIATAPGSGALAILRVSGPQALRTADAVLRIEPGAWRPRHAMLGAAHDSQGLVDEVLAVFFPGPRSATGEDVVELTCHGSPYIQRRLLAALVRAGARPARPGEFTQRAFLNGRLDLAQAEAVCDLIRAGTHLAHRAALEQLSGGLSQAVAGLRAPILELLVQLEARLDHPDEDLPALPGPRVEAELSRLAEPVKRLLETFTTGRILREGARICIAGRPNAGKSSLLNALLGCRRAIVCDEPGTTRDTIEEPWDLQGLPAVLIDTAGLGHPAAGSADAESLRRAEQALASSDLALLVVDGARPQAPEDSAAHRRILESSRADKRPVIMILNKCDLPQFSERTEDATVRVSARTGAGLDALRRLVLSRLAPDAGRPEPGGIAVTSQRHSQALRRCAAELAEGVAAVQRHPDRWEELAARHLRESLAALDEIIGPAAPDEVLGEIFSRFCVGK